MLILCQQKRDWFSAPKCSIKCLAERKTKQIVQFQRIIWNYWTIHMTVLALPLSCAVRSSRHSWSSHSAARRRLLSVGNVPERRKHGPLPRRSPGIAVARRRRQERVPAVDDRRDPWRSAGAAVGRGLHARAKTTSRKDWVCLFIYLFDLFLTLVKRTSLAVNAHTIKRQYNEEAI